MICFDTVLVYTGCSFKRHYNTKRVEKYVRLKKKLRNALYEIIKKMYMRKMLLAQSKQNSDLVVRKSIRFLN